MAKPTSCSRLFQETETMFKIRVARRVAAAVLAATLALGGAVGFGGAGADDPHDTAGTEQAGATWSFTGDNGGKDWHGTNGATWS